MALNGRSLLLGGANSAAAVGGGRPGGWRDSAVRRSLPDELVAFLDSEAVVSDHRLGCLTVPPTRGLLVLETRRGGAAGEHEL